MERIGGNVSSAASAAAVLAQTGARGLMIGRGAIRNPWLFAQIRQQQRGEPLFAPRGRDVLAYVHALYRVTMPPAGHMPAQVQKMKRDMNHLCLGVEPTGRFLHDIRRVATEADFLRVCDEFLDHEQPMPLEPFAAGRPETDGARCD